MATNANMHQSLLCRHTSLSSLTAFPHKFKTGQLPKQGSHLSSATACCSPSPTPSQICRRRDVLQVVATTTTLLAWPQELWAADNRQLSISELKDVVEKDFVQNQYYVTGKLSPQVYASDCVFKDPTTNVKGVQPYTSAVSKLFDPSKSRADLISLKISGPDSLVLQWRLAAVLNIPGSPAIKPYTGTTKYVTNQAGLVCQHLEQWDISAFDAFVSVLFPNFGAPPAPPVSELIAKQ